jgi:1-acyl-sn-glycerol-3-phosphate acyltransferase
VIGAGRRRWLTRTGDMTPVTTIAVGAAVILYRALIGMGYRPFMRTLFRMEIGGADRIPASGPCILVANHESIADPYVLGVVTERPIHFMAKRELWRSRVGRFLMEGFGAFPVERGTGDDAAMGRAGQLLGRGEVLGIFPQGTCVPRRKRPYLRGAARLALATGSPLVPVCLVGTERLVRPHRVKLGLPKLRILVGRPLDVAGQRPTLVAARRLTRHVEEAIAELRHPYGEPRHVWID